MASPITKADVLNYFQSHGKTDCVKYLMNCNSENNPSQRAYEKSLEKLVAESRKVKRSADRKGSSIYDSFLKESYIFPTVSSIRSRITHDEMLDIDSSFREIKTKSNVLLNEKGELTEQVNKLKNKLDIKEEKLDSCKKQLKRTVAREKYIDKKVRRLEESINSECCSESNIEISFLQQQLQAKDNEISQLKKSLQHLQDEEKEESNNEVNLFDEHSKRYTSEFKQCVYELLQCNVSAAKVCDVVNSVLKLVSLKPNKLPSKSTILEMNLQRLCIAQTQVAEIFSKQENTTLLTDETSKFGSKFMGYEAADSEGNLWVLGLRDIETKSADNTLKVFKDILSDLDEKSSNADNQVSKDIISHISATMSDRAATEVKFNQLLETYRKEVLPLTYANYEQFTEEEKGSMESLSNFFCGLHALVNYAETAQKCVKEVEQGLFQGKGPSSDTTYKGRDDEPGACRLVRTAAKAFGEGSSGDEKSGCQGSFKTFIADFLKENNMNSVPLRSYRGSRFNILFSNAAVVFFLHEEMISFLETYGAENRLLKSILFDLKTKEYIAGMKALGLISKLITCPLWSILEDKGISIVDMNAKYLELVTFLDESARNVQAFMGGEMTLFGDRVKRDNIFESLMQQSEFDETVQSYLEVVLAAMCTLGKKLYKDHLPGGKFQQLNDEKLKGVPKTSCFAESVFGQLDYLVRTKPNLSTLAAESCIMFVNNKTLQWLDSKDELERKNVIKAASSAVKDLRSKYKSRLHEIQEHRKIIIQEKIRKKEKIEREKIRKQEILTSEIMRHGLWQSENEVDNMLNSYEKSSEKIEVLKAQLKFRKEVLLQLPENKASFNLTKSVEGKKSRKSLTNEELAINLKTLVKQAVVKDSESNEEKHVLVGKRVRHRFQEKEGDGLVTKWYTGKVISQVPWFPEWFNLIYDGDEAVYTYHHLGSDAEKQDLQILL